MSMTTMAQLGAQSAHADVDSVRVAEAIGRLDLKGSDGSSVG
jgi:hypothetical protein